MAQLGLEESLGIPRTAIQSFVLSVRARMLDNPYHNWAHVVDVTQVLSASAAFAQAALPGPRGQIPRASGKISMRAV